MQKYDPGFNWFDHKNGPKRSAIQYKVGERIQSTFSLKAPKGLKTHIDRDRQKIIINTFNLPKDIFKK